MKVKLKYSGSKDDYPNENRIIERCNGKDFVFVPIEREKLIKILKEVKNSWVNFFAPTQVMTFAFCIIFLLAVGGSIHNSFSMESFFLQDLGLDGKASSFEIGYPVAFIIFSMSNEVPFVFKFWVFLGNFLLYILVAYILDLVISNSCRVITKFIKNNWNKKETITIS